MTTRRLALCAALLCGLTGLAHAADYPIRPEPVADGSWAVIADTGYFTPDNGGFLVNTAFIATADDAKRPLDGRCDVTVSGVTPPARFWTLTLYDTKGHLIANALQRYGFTSEEIVRNADGSFVIRLAARARSGNWLPTGGIERYQLMLRLYDTPVGIATRTQRDACARKSP